MADTPNTTLRHQVLAHGSTGSATAPLKTDAHGELQIDVVSSALPSGAATEAKQDSIVTTLGSPAQAGEAASATTGLATESTLATLDTTTKRVADAVDTDGILLRDDTGAGFGLRLVSGQPRVLSVPYYYAISAGEVAGHAALLVQADIAGAAATWTDFWGGTAISAICPVLSTAAAMEIVSSSAQDAAAGTGTAQVEIVYIDAAGAEQVQVATLTGVTPVAVGNILHIQAAYVVAGGTGASVPVAAAGAIDIRTVAGATVYSRIPSGRTDDPRFVWRIPAGKVGHMLAVDTFCLASANNSSVRLRMVANRDPVDGSTLPSGVWHTKYQTGGGSGGTTNGITFALPLVFSAGQIVRAQLIRLTGSGTAEGSITASGWLE